VQEELSLFDQVLSGTLTSTSREFPEENEVVLEEAETSLPEEDSPATSIESTSSPEESVSADVDAQMPSEAPLVLDLTPSVTDPLESIIPEPITTEF
jgi:hypothetical protein